ncbi:S9 family peptidase [Flavobacterium sp. SLB02]|nr:prolyl oligopeptidase family serine peptidase [Flavobacterium sp. SLB02]QGK73182.1 prolyl oligopeptidase family serine peptidase [Flavobacterium sp. SLB02]
MGHSFGGYQTTYIITQTGLFAAAVAGSAVTDLTSYYFTVNWKSGRPTMNYFQKGQLRMMQSPYEIPELYKGNSPLVYADRITTPLLSFTGKEDNHVDWHQSVELYLAMRRLGKKHVMLLYPNEAHSLFNPSNQKDLSLRIQQWFGYYLKGQTPAPWITEAIK